MQIDPSADRARYKQLADLIRTQIHIGVFAPGQRLPAQKDYAQKHGLSRNTVGRAMNLLRGEGLIVADGKGNANRVRARTTRTTVYLPRGTVSARMPTEPERKKLGIDEGVPVLVSQRVSGDGEGEGEEIYPADGFEIQGGYAVPDDDPGPVTRPALDDENAVPPPEHLSALMGALQGPADLGRNHDKYLTYCDHGDSGVELTE